MRKATLLLALFGLIGSLWAADPMMGTFKLNLAKSKIPAGMATAKESLMTFRELDANTIEATSKDTRNDGSVVTAKWTTPKNGGIQTYQQGGPEKGTSIFAVVVDSNIAYNVFMQNGKQVFLLRVNMSKDGKTFTSTTKGTDAQGKPYEGLWFFEKQ